MPKKQLLLIVHAPSPNTQKMLDALVKGASNSEITKVKVKSLSPFDVKPEDVYLADAIILGTTENLGYMSGALKDFFDRCYYPCLDKTQGKAFTFYIRAGHDGTGTRRGIESITTGLAWRLVQEPLVCKGEFDPVFVEQCEELGMLIAASLDAGII